MCKETAPCLDKALCSMQTQEKRGGKDERTRREEEEGQGKKVGGNGKDANHATLLRKQ